MTVKDYALDVNLSVAEVLKKCQALKIEVTGATDMLNDEDIVLLDNTINLISSDADVTFAEAEQMDTVVDNIIANSNLDHQLETNVHQQKLKKPSSRENLKEFQNLKKEMYKHKGKLKTNQPKTDLILYQEGMTVADLAHSLEVKGTELIKKIVDLGQMLALNQPIDYETAAIISLDYHKTLKRAQTQDVANFEEFEIVDQESDLIKRPPIVTIMGHVDHGKTTLLDYIRNTHVVAKESGGITQHIGAYQIETKANKITFIDTPGHEAFTEMRARGAKVTDIVVIVVAADDGVMPQTKEAVDHALSAQVPIIVAVNKIDLPKADVAKVYTEMADLNLTPESWGGETPFVDISAKTGTGVDLLLKTILTVSELKEFKANPNRYAVGSVIESKLDKNVGGVASLLILNGTLRIGDPLVVGVTHGRVRTMKDDKGHSLVEAGPSTPVEITGLSGNPKAGDKFMAFETEAEAKNVAAKRLAQLKESKWERPSANLEELFAQLTQGKKEVNVILKADVRGSEEAVKNALQKIDVDGIKIVLVRSGIGTITESDVVLANASKAIIIGFNVIPANTTKEIAKEYKVDIRLYTVIYKVIEEMELALKGMLDPEFKEKITGKVEIRKLFKFSKIGHIAGCYVTEGVIKNDNQCRIIRDGIVIGETKIKSIKRGKDFVKEVKKGFECGLTFDNFNDIQVGDSVEVFEMIMVEKQ